MRRTKGDNIHSDGKSGLLPLSYGNVNSSIECGIRIAKVVHH